MPSPRLLLALVPLALATACSSPSGDPHATPNPDPLGGGARIRDITNTNLTTHPKPSPNPVGCLSVNTPVNVTGAVVLWNDVFDETGDGKSRGSVYVQDVGPQTPPVPFSGIGVFSPSYVPADLRIAPGDVLDMNGPYQEATCIGSARFGMGQVLPQLAKPVGTFRYEYKVPDPASIDVNDLNDYTKGRQWLGMLVTVHDVTVQGGQVDSSGHRVTYALTTAGSTSVSMSNELYDLRYDAFPAGTHFKSVTGIVTWFFNYHVAPRTPQDLVQ